MLWESRPEDLCFVTLVSSQTMWRGIRFHSLWAASFLQCSIVRLGKMQKNKLQVRLRYLSAPSPARALP